MYEYTPETVMIGIIDSHVHVTMGAGYDLVGGGFGELIICNSKQEALDIIADYIQKNPGKDRYRFLLDKKYLKGNNITKEDLDAICPDGELQIQEAQGHSIWVNSNILKKHGITDEIKDPIPGISFYVRKDADFLVFDNDLLTAEHEGFSHNMPGEVYFGGKKVN